MITKLTTGNKKEMVCPFCQQTVQWNTKDEVQRLGHRILICPECGKDIDIPKTFLKPKFQEVERVHYTNNIYPSEQSEITPTGTLEITENGFYDVTEYAGVQVETEGSDNVVFKTTLLNETVTTSLGGGESTPRANLETDISWVTNLSGYADITIGTTLYENIPYMTDTSGYVYFWGAPFDSDNNTFDFSEYPFQISSYYGQLSIYTEEVGTYNVTIELVKKYISESVTITNNLSQSQCQLYSENQTFAQIPAGATQTVDMVFVEREGINCSLDTGYEDDIELEITGNITKDEDTGNLFIWGSGTIIVENAGENSPNSPK